MPLSIESIDKEIADLRLQMNQIAETIRAAESLKSALQEMQNRQTGVRRPSPQTRNSVAPAVAPTPVAVIGRATDAIREAIAKCRPSFTINDVAAKLEEAGIDTIARTTITQTLSEWGRAGKIAVKSQGHGTVPSVYRTIKKAAKPGSLNRR
jgi:hypothetical protein